MLRISYIIRKAASEGYRFMNFIVNPLGLFAPLRNHGGDEIVQTVDQRSRFDAMLKIDFIIYV